MTPSIYDPKRGQGPRRLGSYKRGGGYAGFPPQTFLCFERLVRDGMFALRTLELVLPLRLKNLQGWCVFKNQELKIEGRGIFFCAGFYTEKWSFFLQKNWKFF